MDELNKNGYIIFKNSVQTNDIPNDISNINEKINYTNIKNFIDNKFLPIIKIKLPYFSNPKYTKFRYSNNNNSIDASMSRFKNCIFLKASTSFFRVRRSL